MQYIEIVCSNFLRKEVQWEPREQSEKVDVGVSLNAETLLHHGTFIIYPIQKKDKDVFYAYAPSSFHGLMDMVATKEFVSHTHTLTL